MSTQWVCCQECNNVVQHIDPSNPGLIQYHCGYLREKALEEKMPVEHVALVWNGRALAAEIALDGGCEDGTVVVSGCKHCQISRDMADSLAHFVEDWETRFEAKYRQRENVRKEDL